MPTGSDHPGAGYRNFPCVIPTFTEADVRRAAPTDAKPGCFVVDLDPIRDFLEAVDDLGRRWAAFSPPIRRSLSRLIWLHPSGEVVQYRPPEEPPCRSDG